ncbi:hypothetical protein JCGZ_09431 [Jatropha curcas]|uniref:Uncharacterized protein n=1 Tax=Jatropha curcas TaxID=180498 RepID=A0A067KGQ1_JATCU|nr:hypothetical protein JCGZ_09431 [Jatropha curcas]
MDNLKANSIQTVFYPVTEEDNNCKNGNTNSVNACQVPKRVHHFYDVKFFSSEDRTCRFRIEELEKLINCINLERLELYKKLEERQFERNEERLRMERLLKRESELKTDLLWQKRKLLLLQHAVSKPSFADNAYRERAIRSCSSMEEETSFQARMRARNLRFHLLHGTNTLAKEREIFRETNNESPNGASDSSLSEEDPIDLIWQLYWHSWQWPKNEQVWIRQIHEEVKLLKWTKEKSIANAAAKASIWDAFGSKQTLQEKIKVKASIEFSNMN